MTDQEPKWVMTKEAKERIEKTSLQKFTPEQREDLKKLAKLIEKELSGIEGENDK